jgi:hypothetical protein
MKNVMRKEQLGKRFDNVHVSHIVSLWHRLSLQMTCLLKDRHRKVFWNCQEVLFEYDSIEDAPLLALLSDGSDPEEGNDLLFIVINSVVNKYNRYVERFLELHRLSKPTEGDTATKTIHPKTILLGSAGSVATNLLPLLTKTDTNNLSAAAWNEDVEGFDFERLSSLLKEGRFHEELPPLIRSPLQLLREKFSFRDDQEIRVTSESRSGLVFALPSGLLFAREQDATLARRALGTMERFAMTKRDPSIAGPLKVNFHSLDSHQQISSMLDGLCNFFDLMYSEGQTQFLGMKSTMESYYYGQRIEELMTKMGFPELSLSQWQLLGSLKPEQVVELVHYLNYQLAVEGYLYAKYDLCVTDSMEPSNVSFIQQKIGDLCSSQGPERTLEAVGSFVDDILGHYKKELCKEALRSATSLRSFLVDTNALDSTDDVLLCLPPDLSVRNYVSLLQVLRQVKLSLRMKTSQPGAAPKDHRKHERSNRDQCWLWDGGSFDSNNVVDVEDAAGIEDEELWFASAVSAKKRSLDVVADSEELLGKSKGFEKESLAQEDGDIKPSVTPMADVESHPLDTDVAERTEIKSANLIQRWWRFQLKMKTMHFMDDEPVDEEAEEHQEEGGELEKQNAHPVSDLREILEDDGVQMTEAPNEPSDVGVRQDQTDTSGNDGFGADDFSTVLAWSRQVGLSLPASKKLLELGARTLEDIEMVVADRSLLSLLPLLDQSKVKASCGSTPDELKSWLAKHSLGPGVEEQLRELGATTVEDIHLMITECEEMLDGLSKLDRFKLKRAFQS